MTPSATETQFLVIGAWGQLLVVLVLAAMLAWQYRLHPRPTLALWAAGFIALGVYVVGAAWSFGLAQRGAPVGHPWRLAAMVLSLAAAHAQLALLALGTLRLSRREHVPRRVLAIAVGGSALLGVLLALSYGSGVTAADERDMLLRLGLLYVLQGVTWLLCGASILLRRAPRGAFGLRALGAGFAAFGTIKLTLVATIVGGTPGTGEAPASGLVVLVEMLGYVAAGTGIALWLLGDERRRAAAAQAHVSTLLRFDPVTGLRNRAAMAEAWLALRGERPLLMVLAVEGVERVDARLTGGIDAVLRALAARLEEQHGAERVAQLDRARFTILGDQAQAPSREAASAALQTCEAVLDHVAPQEELWPVAGVAGPRANEDLAAQLARASAACEAARRLGGSRLVEAEALTASADNDDGVPRLRALREAFARREFELHFQPQFDADHGGLHGFEALVRWRHPEAGLLLPGRFMDAIGRTGLARRLDAVVVELACARLRQWLDEGLRPPPVAVNLGAESLADPELPEMLGDALVRHRVPAALLAIELTETAALADVERCARVLGRLRAFGFAAALDDFGTGFSSLAHLRDLPVDTIKIDRRFVHGAVREARDAALVRGLAALASSLGLRVVAEGVETAE
ncbi:MAG: EAL domain-containing protein [Xanthomonadaceae bacterium]|jgi:EAL domain-containing protein (putative c-di-GMP-specific phosphodiesterase class I)/GGDEF domain-containing protein|nr:EAL domain-containing protein [Xanthomonadaceae bacterium]